MQDLIQQVRAQLAAVPDLVYGSRLGAATPGSPVRIAQMIDHTLLKPDATPTQIEQLCAEAVQYTFASVCVNPCYVALCHHLLEATPVKIATVIGFPLGATTSATKVFEAMQACADGARELDMVLNIGLLKAGHYHDLSAEIHQIATAAHSQGALLKVIIETALLSDAEKVAACIIAAQAGADMVKTSTGFAGGGATVADVALMRQTVGAEMGVKASGGVRSLADAQALIAAGANRIGTSAGVVIALAESEH